MPNRHLDVLRFIKELEKAYGAARWDDVITRAKAKGIEKSDLEDIINDLLERGRIIEPRLAEFKVV